MKRITFTIAGLFLVSVLAGAAQAAQHHMGRGMMNPCAMQGMQQRGEDEEGERAPLPGPMLQRMQSMMRQMQSMMRQMQGMMNMMGMGPGGMMGPGMMGRGMMGRGGTRGMPGHGMMAWLSKELKLSAEQEQQVRALVRAHKKEAIRAKADLAVKRIELRELLEAESVDMAKVKALLQTIATQKAEMRFAHITLMQEVSKMLTPEQQKRFRRLRGRLFDHSMMGRGMRGHGMMGMMGRGMMNPCSMMGMGRRGTMGPGPVSP